MQIRMKSVFILMFAGLLADPAGAEEAVAVESRSFAFAGGGELTILSEDGEMDIQSWDRDSLRVETTRRAWGSTWRKAEAVLKTLHVQFIESSDRIEIRERNENTSRSIGLFDILDGDFWREKGWRDARIDYVIRVPEQIRIKLRHDTGPVSIQGTEGDVRVSADEGEVRLSRIRSDDIMVETDEADVRLEDVAQQHSGLCRIALDEGDIRCTNIEMHALDIECDEGDVFAADADVLECRVTADEGRIRFSFDPREAGRYAFSTDEGFIDLILPQSAQVRMHFWTEEGRIQTNADLPVRRFDEGEQLEADLGDHPSARLKASTDEGDIRLTLE